MIEIKVKNIDLNIEKEIRFLLANENKHLLDCEIEETDDECIFKFDDEGLYGFETVDVLSKEEKYRLLVNIADIEELSEEYCFCLSPSNIVYDINLVPKILIRDKRTKESDFYIQYKALVSSVLYNKYTFEQYIGGSAKVPEKSFIKNIDDTKSLKEELLKRYLKERETNINTKVQVKKSEYKKLKLSIPITALIAVGILVYGIFVHIDTNIFDFWIALGRCEFGTAEDIAKKIGNNEFLLFTYIKHSAYLKADVTITGEEKESAISDLDKKIKELSESMGVNKQE